jgi:hypothetical protein
MASSINQDTSTEEIDGRMVYMEDLEKRIEVYGICGECNEPGTGYRWCQPCNDSRKILKTGLVEIKILMN